MANAPTLGEAAARAVDELRARVPVSLEVPRTTFDKQLAYLERRHGGAGGAAAAAGVTPRTWARWRSGRSRPTGSSQGRVKAAYEAGKRPELAKVRRTLAAKKALGRVRMQISGVARVSSDSRYRRHYCSDDLVGLDLSHAWAIRTDRAALAVYFTQVMQLATHVPATWPDSEQDEQGVTIDLLF